MVHGRPYDNKSDIWALGCVLYEICALCKPFDASNIPGIILKIVRANPRPIDASYSDDLKKMIACLLQPNPELRPTADEIEAMPIVRVCVDCLIACLIGWLIDWLIDVFTDATD